MSVEQVAIIGAGPAGLAAAIQLRRNGIGAVLFEKEKVGGLLWNANLVENYPGFPHGIAGTALVRRFIQQAEHLGIKPTHQQVIDVAYERDVFRLMTEQYRYEAKILVIATGTKPVPFTGFSIPQNLAGLVYYEVRELLNKNGKQMIIVGSGDAAFDYALNLSRNNKVTILNRSAETRCLPLLWERTQQSAKISYHGQTEICGLQYADGGGMLVDCQEPGGVLQFHADYLIGAIGREAQLDCLTPGFRHQMAELQDASVLYLVGDVKNGIYRQTTIAVGDGVMAAMKICRCLKENDK